MELLMSVALTSSSAGFSCSPSLGGSSFTSCDSLAGRRSRRAAVSGTWNVKSIMGIFAPSLAEAPFALTIRCDHFARVALSRTSSEKMFMLPASLGLLSALCVDLKGEAPVTNVGDCAGGLGNPASDCSGQGPFAANKLIDVLRRDVGGASAIGLCHLHPSENRFEFHGYTVNIMQLNVKSYFQASAAISRASTARRDATRH